MWRCLSLTWPPAGVHLHHAALLLHLSCLLGQRLCGPLSHCCTGVSAVVFSALYIVKKHLLLLTSSCKKHWVCGQLNSHLIAMIPCWLFFFFFFFFSTPSSFKDFPPIYVLGSSWGSSLETTISQHRPLVGVISGRFYSSDVLCESGLLDSCALLAGARDKSHLRSMKHHTCSTVKNTPFRVNCWRGRSDRFVYLWNEQSSRPFSDRGHFSLRLWESSHIHTNPLAISLTSVSCFYFFPCPWD